MKPGIRPSEDFRQVKAGCQGSCASSPNRHWLWRSLFYSRAIPTSGTIPTPCSSNAQFTHSESPLPRARMAHQVFGGLKCSKPGYATRILSFLNRRWLRRAFQCSRENHRKTALPFTRKEKSSCYTLRAFSIFFILKTTKGNCRRSRCSGLPTPMALTEVHGG